MKVYEIRFYGDLDGDPMVYNTLEGALEDLAREWGWLDPEAIEDRFGNKRWIERFTPDPEDDRVVIWEIEPGEKPKAVWHFSGWHWDFDASDLNGGPLDQGELPHHGTIYDGKSLYEIAMRDY